MGESLRTKLEMRAGKAALIMHQLRDEHNNGWFIRARQLLGNRSFETGIDIATWEVMIHIETDDEEGFITLRDPVDGFPSEELIAKLALVGQQSRSPATRQSKLRNGHRHSYLGGNDSHRN